MSDLSEIANYEIIRRIGEGGYGTVYLAKLKNRAEYLALKIIASKGIERERKALEKYLNISDRNNMVEIIDFGSTKEFLYYCTPLADSLDENFQPEDFRWQPKSLQNLIERKLEGSSTVWFSHSEILDMISPVFDAAIVLGENKLLHRDIKPDSVLFFCGKAKLADFGLVEQDVRSLSNIGTPLYIAPSWYVNKGGNPDAYGIAATLYTLISGNLPDTLGRPAYRFPEKEVLERDRERWLHWHRCILRAISENPADRYVSLKAFKDAVFSDDFESSKTYNAQPKSKINSKKTFFAIALCTVCLVVAFLLAGKFRTGISPDNVSYANRAEYKIPDEIYLKIKKNGFHSGGFFIEDINTWKAGKQSVLNEWSKNLEKSKALAEKTEEQVIAIANEKFLREWKESPESITHSGGEKLKEIRDGEIKLALFEWRNARMGLPDELTVLEELKDAVNGDEQYKQYVSEIYENYLKSLK